MSARGFLILFIFLTVASIGGLVFHFSTVPNPGESVLLLLHIFNIGFSSFCTGRSIVFGITYGWKS